MTGALVRRLAASVLAAVALAATVVAPARGEGVPDAATRAVGAVPGVATGPLVAPGRETEPVVLTGADVAAWSVPADQTVAVPDFGGARCAADAELPDQFPPLGEGECTPNTYEEPQVSRQGVAPLDGTPVDRLLAYRWDGTAFAQVPFQVDEVFTRYLSNNRSGFAFYSNTDAHTSYAFDREGFRWTASHPEDPCLAAPASELATDPVVGLDSDDELVFMARDAGPRAPSTAGAPSGVEEMLEVTVTDPYRPDVAGYVYLARAAEGGPVASFDADTGYVRYERDAHADVFRFSESSYEDYGNAPPGPWMDDAGVCHAAESEWRQRRPGDQATITTPRYRFRYDGRWLMTELQVSADRVQDGDWTYGPDLIDQWKARAFQQRPGGQTPCCGFEEEVNNWGGSSILLGERWGPVRVIRETWGADSGTNVVRRETFYRDEIHQTSFLRVHPIPPLDGIYAQWDHTAAAITKYFNPLVPDGVAVDGQNDEVFGNSRVHVGPDGVSFDDPVLGGTPVVVGDPQEPGCGGFDDVCTYNDIDTADPFFSGVNALLPWEQVSGPGGTLVSRFEAADVTAGGTAHALFALPYYRDDSCFDDGTGSDPGPHLRSRGTDDGEFATWTDDAGNVLPRECWDAGRHATEPVYAADLGSRRFWQGSMGTHGLHLLLIAESDNAAVTVPSTEIVSTQRIVTLPPTEENVGEQYGRRFEKPLLTSVAPFGSGAPPGGVGQWLAGDLHVHTVHSHDSYGGPTDDNTGPDEAYTLGWTVEQQFGHAAVRGLDYLAITDHNDIRSQEAAGYGGFGVIPVPGYENSLDGHAQMLGATRSYDNGAASAGDVQRIADELRDEDGDRGAFQVNHPAEGSLDWPHDADWGYGYDVRPDTVEVWNISRLWQPPFPSASSNDDAIRYWEGWLDRGSRVAATGGSDNHWVSTAAAQGVGQPTTWVLAGHASTDGVLDGLRRGRTFISHQPPSFGGPRLFLEGDADGDGTFEAVVGDAVPPGAQLRVRGEGVAGGLLRLVRTGGVEASDPVPVSGPTFVHEFAVPDGATWVRAELLLPDGTAERRALCDPTIGHDTTYCRNMLLVQAMTSAMFVGTPAAPTVITIEAPASAAHTDSVEVAAVLTSESAPVAGRQVDLTLAGVTASGTTDGDGVARVTIPLADPPGTYEIVAAFAGDDEYAPSQATAPFTIEHETTVLEWVGDTSARGETVELAARLTEDDGPAVAAREVVFEARGEQWTASTEADGVARVTATIPDHGRSVNVTATFAGDATHASSSTAATLTWGGGGRNGGAGKPSGTTGEHWTLASSLHGRELPTATAALLALVVLAALTASLRTGQKTRSDLR